LATIPPNGPVVRPAPRPAKKRPRGAAFTPERAKLVAQERERRRRANRLARAAMDAAAERVAATLEAKAARASDPLDSRARTASRPVELASGLRNAEPIVLPALVEAPDGSLTLPEPLKLPSAPMSDDRPQAAPRTQPSPRSPQRGPVPDLAMPRSARLPAPVEPVELEPVKLPPAPVVKLVASSAPDPALEAGRIARARVCMARLFDAIRSPHLARFSIPWQPEVLVRAGVCAGCAQRIAADRVEGHAISAATKPTPKLRCVRWAFGIPEDRA